MTAAYFDTCSLLCWAYSRLPQCTAEDTAAAQFVDRLVGEPRVTAVSAITLIEFYDNVALKYRSGAPGADEAWLGGVMADLARWQAGGALDVLDAPAKLFEHAMRYVKINTDAGPFKFRAMDAAHLVHVVEMSRRRGEQVELVSYDTDFLKLIRRYAGFKQFVVQVDPRSGADLTHRA